MLSNENKQTLTEAESAVAWREAATAAKRLGQQLVKHERNADPKEHLNAPNPANGIRIRVIRPRPMVLPVDDSVKQHNSAVASFGREGTFTS